MNTHAYQYVGFYLSGSPGGVFMKENEGTAYIVSYQP